MRTPICVRESLISAISVLVFSFLDLLDFLLCFVYRFVDAMLEENPSSHCYCQHHAEGSATEGGRGDVLSETLYGRSNIFRNNGLRFTSWLVRRREGGAGAGFRAHSHRWSDCGCDWCTSWQREEEERLHIVVKEPAQSQGTSQDWRKSSTESVIFFHGFLSSSSFWVETVFPNLSDSAKSDLRMFAIDLLGFGRSPKPANCLYTLEEHLEQIERSVIKPFQLNSFHLVAHSMGCIVAISLAAKYPESVKSVTLIAPPYFPSTGVRASYTALNRLAERKVWPPLLFGSSVMSWYEHLGRTVCFIVCRNHLKWERLIKLVTRRRDLHFAVTDLTKHTHHSAWHTMHNVICGGAKSLDKFLEVMKREEIPVKVVQGARDEVVPLECSYNVKWKIPHAELQIVVNTGHTSVILGREKAFTKELEDTWFCSRKKGEVLKNILSTC